jgi:hypothetical protein
VSVNSQIGICTPLGTGRLPYSQSVNEFKGGYPYITEGGTAAPYSPFGIVCPGLETNAGRYGDIRKTGIYHGLVSMGEELNGM